MDAPYKPKHQAYDQMRKAAQEERVITLKDDSAQPPPSVSSPAFQGILFGPAVGQPSKAGDDIRPGWGKRVLGRLFWLWVAAVVISALYRLAQ